MSTKNSLLLSHPLNILLLLSSGLFLSFSLHPLLVKSAGCYSFPRESVEREFQFITATPTAVWFPLKDLTINQSCKFIPCLTLPFPWVTLSKDIFYYTRASLTLNFYKKYDILCIPRDTMTDILWPESKTFLFPSTCTFFCTSTTTTATSGRVYWLFTAGVASVGKFLLHQLNSVTWDYNNQLFIHGGISNLSLQSSYCTRMYLINIFIFFSFFVFISRWVDSILLPLARGL